MKKVKYEDIAYLADSDKPEVMKKSPFLIKKNDRKVIMRNAIGGKFYTHYNRPPKPLFTEFEDTRTITETAGVRTMFERIMELKRAGIMLDNYRKEHYDINPGTEEEDYCRLWGLERHKVDPDTISDPRPGAPVPPDEDTKKEVTPADKDDKKVLDTSPSSE
jgi:hypothetical protein